MVDEKANKIRVQLQFIVEWPKGLLRVFGAPLKRLFCSLADLFHQIYLWLKGPWPWL